MNFLFFRLNFLFYVVWGKSTKIFCKKNAFFSLLFFFLRLPRFFSKLFIELRRVRVLALYELNSRVFWLGRKNIKSVFGPHRIFFRMRFGLYNSFTCVTIFFRRSVVCTILYNKNVILFFLLLFIFQPKKIYTMLIFFMCARHWESERIWKNSTVCWMCW